MRFVIVTLIAISMILSTAVPASSHRGGNVDIAIVSDNGDEFYTIPFRDIQGKRTRIIKKYLEARKGENYGIVIRNNIPERIGVVIAVDGRNIISSKKSYLRNDESMYIVNAYGYAKYEGWRTDSNTVHRFYFTDIGDSYAMRTFGDSSAMGVISVAVFREKERPVHHEKRHREGAPSPSAEAPARSESGKFKSDDAGTGFGNSKYSPAIKVKFEPESNPFKKLLVKYEWRDVLCMKGIIKCLPEVGNRLWDDSEYAPYPPGYSGN